MGPPRWLSSKRSYPAMQEMWFDNTWVRKSPWVGNSNPLRIRPGKSCGQKSLGGLLVYGILKLDVTEHAAICLGHQHLFLKKL